MLCNIFQTQSLGYNLRRQADFLRSGASTSQYCLNSLRYFVSKVWDMVLLETEKSNSIESF